MTAPVQMIASRTVPKSARSFIVKFVKIGLVAVDAPVLWPFGDLATLGSN